MNNELTLEQQAKKNFELARKEWEGGTDKTPSYFLQIFTHEGDGCFTNRQELAACFEDVKELIEAQAWSGEEKAQAVRHYKEAILPELRRTYEPYTVDAFFKDVSSWNPLDEFRPQKMKDVAFQKGTFNIIGARPGSGKTTLAVSLALQAVEWRGEAADNRVIFLSFEETPKQVYARFFNHLLFAKAKADNALDAIQCEKPRAQLFGAIKSLDQHPLKERISDIAAYMRGLEARGALQVINFAGKSISAIESLLKFHEGAVCFIDYAQLIRPSEQFAGYELAGLNDISRRLADCAKDNNAIIIAAAQLRRAGFKDAGDSDIPSMLTDSRLKDCGQLEQDANTIIELGKNTDWADIAREEHDTGAALYFWKLVKNRDGGGVNNSYLFNTAGGAMGYSYMESTETDAGFLEESPKEERKAGKREKEEPQAAPSRPAHGIVLTADALKKGIENAKKRDGGPK